MATCMPGDMSRLTRPASWNLAEAVVTHRRCAVALDDVHRRARRLAADVRVSKTAPGLRHSIQATGTRLRRALADVLRQDAGAGSRWRFPDALGVYACPSPPPRLPPPACCHLAARHLGPAIRALDHAVRRSHDAVDDLRFRTRLPRDHPAWQAVALAVAADVRALEAAWRLVRDVAARAVQTAWRRAWYEPGMGIWRRRMMREFEELTT